MSGVFSSVLSNAFWWPHISGSLSAIDFVASEHKEIVPALVRRRPASSHTAWDLDMGDLVYGPQHGPSSGFSMNSTEIPAFSRRASKDPRHPGERAAMQSALLASSTFSVSK